MEKQLKPKLRFPEFYGEWEICKLSKFIKNLLSGVSVNSIDREINQNEFGILKTSSVVNGKFISTENKLIVIEEIERAKLNPKKHNLLISRMNTPDLVGNFGYIEKNYPNLFIPDRLWMTDLNNNIHPKYLNYSLLTPKSKNKITSLATGTSNSMKNISKSSFLDIEIYTASIPEQQKIADYLTTIDRKIELLEEKKTELSRYKKAMMQKLFSQEIRFIDDNGNDFADWEEKRLGDIGFFQTSSIDKLIREDESEVYLINYMNVYRHEKINNETITGFQKVTAKENQIKSCDIREGDILFTPSSETPSDIGHSVVIFENIPNSVFSYHLMRFRPNIKLDLMYSHYFCNIPKVLNQLTKYATGSTRFTISVKSFSNVVVDIPTLPEQQKIAKFLSAIDESIDNVSDQLVEMQCFKKAMLQQMFV